MTAPSGFQITCANKNQNGTIVRVGGSGWSLSLHEIIVKIISNQRRYSIYIGDTQYEIGVRGDGGNAYLVLEPDGKPLSEIDGLQSC